MLKYVKVQQNQRKTTAKGAAVNVVDGEWQPLGPSGDAGEAEAEADWIQHQAEVLEELRQSGVDESTQVQVLAVMRARFKRSLAGRMVGLAVAVEVLETAGRHPHVALRIFLV